MTRPPANGLEKSIRDGFEGMRSDLQQKHTENREAWAFEQRMTAVETKLTSIIGDNSGGSGLLHDIDKKVDALSSEVAGTRKVLVFLAVVVPIILSIVGIALALIFRH